MKIWNQRKIYANYILWRIGVRQILPNVIINKKRVYENNSPLVDISKNKNFSFDDRCLNRGGCWVRPELVPMFEKAQSKLPNGYKLHFFGGFRSVLVQWVHWSKNLELQRKNYPNISQFELERIARKTSADPRYDYNPHQTGGAVDLTIVDENGNELDMGTSFSEHSPRAATNYKNISDIARKNRKILLKVMSDSGFQNYPGEWWHYSYGDRAWAAYKRKANAIFGQTKCADYKLKSTELLIQEQMQIQNGF